MDPRLGRLPHPCGSATPSWFMSPMNDRIYHNDGERHRGRGRRHRHVQRHAATVRACAHGRLHRRHIQHYVCGRTVGLAAGPECENQDPVSWRSRLDSRRHRSGRRLAVGHDTSRSCPQLDTPGGPPKSWGADCWNITTVRYRPNLKRVLGATPLPGCSENHGINNPLQSPHPGGLLAGFVDGSVQFISETADFAVLLRIVIRDDGDLIRID